MKDKTMSNNHAFEIIMDFVAAERRTQDKKWGSQHDLTTSTWACILMEEVGEAAEAILEDNPMGLFTEIIQIAAVAVAWAESIVPDEA